MKHIITIQHTQSEQHVNGMIGSWTDWELTALGKARAENIGRKLADELKGQSWKIICSDLIRTKQTAEPLARYLGAEVEYRAKLREHNFGEAVGKSKQWAKENALPVNSFEDRRFPGAESLREFWKRVECLHQEILAYEAENIIVVSHTGTLWAWHRIWQGLDIQWFTSSSSMPGGVSFMMLDHEGKRMITRLNDESYMER